MFEGTRRLARRYREERRARPDLTAERFLDAQRADADYPAGVGREQWVELLDVLRNAPEGEVDALVTEWIEQQSGRGTSQATLPLQAEPEATLKNAAPPPPAEDAQYIDRRYRIVRVLGEGAFGKVFLVKDKLQNDQELALKLIKKEHTATSEALVRFKNEILLLRVLNHPGIPQIFNDGISEDGEFYYTMAYVSGRTLDDVIRKEAPLEPLRIVRITKQVLDVLDYAHARGAIHRDLKPGNIFLLHAGTPKEAVRVLDFGIAKVLSREGILEHAQTMNTEMPLGTPHYMSPEQVRGTEVDGRTDLYALGVIIYQMCSGRFPFSGKTLMEILAARLERPPNPLEDATTPAWLRELVMKLLERERERRPDTQAIRVALEQLHGSHRELSKKLTWIAVAGVAIAGVLAWAVFGRGNGKSSDEHASVPQVPAPATPNDSGEVGGEDDGKHQPARQGAPEEQANSGEERPPAAPDAPKGEGATPPDAGPTKSAPAAQPGPKEPEPQPAAALAPFALLEIEPAASPMPTFPPELKRVHVSGRASRRLASVRIGNATVEPLSSDPLRFEADVDLPEPPLDGRDADAALAIELVEEGTFERVKSSLNYRRGAARIPANCKPAPDAVVDARGRVTSVFEDKSRIALALVDDGPDKPGFYFGVREVSYDEWNRGPINTPEWDAAQGDKPGTHPVAGMTFAAAQHFCDLRGLRLPTAEEWDLAAGLAGGKAFPWGDEFVPGACNSKDAQDAFKDTAPVGSFPQDRCGPFLDMAGNVQEWCADPSGKPVLRGGGWNSVPNACKLTAKGTAPTKGSTSIGFRVALTSPP